MIPTTIPTTTTTDPTSAIPLLQRIYHTNGVSSSALVTVAVICLVCGLAVGILFTCYVQRVPR